MNDREFHLTHRRVTETTVPYSEEPNSDFQTGRIDLKNSTIRYEYIGSLEEEIEKALQELEDKRKEEQRIYRDSVIQECLDVIQKEAGRRYLHHTDGMTEEFMAGHYAGTLTSRIKIKEHFGLEEMK